MNLTFEELAIQNRIRCETSFHHPLNSWSLLEWGGAAAGELGEACNLAKKIKRITDGLGHLNKSDDTPLDFRDKMGEEIADTVIYLDLMASAGGLSLGDLIRDKFNKDSRKHNVGEKL